MQTRFTPMELLVVIAIMALLAALPDAPALDYLGDARPGGDGLYTMGALETPVPEPAALSLAALAVAALALRRRR